LKPVLFLGWFGGLTNFLHRCDREALRCNRCVANVFRDCFGYRHSNSLFEQFVAFFHDVFDFDFLGEPALVRFPDDSATPPSIPLPIFPRFKAVFNWWNDATISGPTRQFCGVFVLLGCQGLSELFWTPGEFDPWIDLTARAGPISGTRVLCFVEANFSEASSGCS
jgi:hypothetical protein